MACIVDEQTFDLTTGSSCNTKGGIKCAFWTLKGNIDWDAMQVDPAAFDPINCCILAFTMIGSAVWNVIKSEPKESTYNAEWTEDSGVYENTISFVFEGKGKEFRNAMCDAINACKLIVKIYDYNCTCRVFGIDYNKKDGTFNDPIKNFRITRHNDSGGVLGGDSARDEVDFGGETECPPMYSEIAKGVFEATYL